MNGTGWVRLIRTRLIRISTYFEGNSCQQMTLTCMYPPQL